MKNPNDITSKYYDIVSKTFKGKEVTEEELSLIEKYSKRNGKILDIGCGTGRHFLDLEKLGYLMTGIDESEGMLEILKSKKRKESRVINANFLDFDFFNLQFDGVIMFWNTFNEICTDGIKAKVLFKKVYEILKPSGVLIINSDNPKNINPKNFDFESITEDGNYKYEYKWKIKDFDIKENVSNSIEQITVKDSSGVVDESKTIIKQKWWTEEEYQNFSREFGFDMQRVRLRSNDELYLVFTKK